MERRKNQDRRQVHVFVADDRRDGPYERRDDDARRWEREQERAKIERIRAFKEKNKASTSALPRITTKRLVYIGLALLILVVAIMLLL
ncbi:hypothetical protein [uncultured Desulfosarcina sp.]|uniref:hypothetical protein n=1 Tax=uncultured Desulfosarcina sp. TaxID=218289 RepID=UPI0029C95EA5|nr:hypothetical protein [uncultured Desulfosarcina sp.]